MNYGGRMVFLKKIQSYADKVTMDPSTARFIRHGRRVWHDWKSKAPQGVVLLYYFDIPSGLISAAYFSNILARKHNADIVAFSSSRRKFPWSLAYWKRDRIYRSFNTTSFLRVDLNEQQAERARTMAQRIWSKIVSKEDVLGIQVDGIDIGIDIYETYLRKYNKPTFDLQDPHALQTVEDGIATLIFWQDYMAHNAVKAIVVSHDTYIAEDILCKLGYQKGIPVYLPNVRGVVYARRPFTVHDPLFRDYRKMFQKLSIEEKEAGLALSQKQLERRFSGEVGVDMSYSTKSAFGSVKAEPVLRKSDKTKIMICSHCFYDNPHGYGGMLFVDFYEWLNFLGQVSQETDYDWYIKMHPDPLPGTEKIIREIISRYPKITFLPPQTSHLQLVAEGINFVLTVYGTVGHELAAMDVQVINAAYNPHYAYDFNWHPASREEYRRYLLNLPNLKKTINKKDIYEFYYMHYFYVNADDLFLKSYREYLSQLKVTHKPATAVYDHFLDNLDDVKHQHICARLSEFIESGKTYYLSKGPQGGPIEIKESLGSLTVGSTGT